MDVVYIAVIFIVAIVCFCLGLLGELIAEEVLNIINKLIHKIRRQK